VGNLLCGRVFVHVRVAHENSLRRQHQGVHGGKRFGVWLQPDHFLNVLQLVAKATGYATQHAVSITPMNQHDTNQGVVLAHHGFGDVWRHPVAAAHFVVGRPGFGEAVVVFRVHNFKGRARLQTQAEALNTHVDDIGAANQDGTGNFFVYHSLHRTQYTLVFAIGVNNALGRALGLQEQRAHQLTRVVHLADQLLAVGLHVFDGAAGHTGVHCRLVHGRGDLDDQAGVERRRNNVFGASLQLFTGVGGSHFIVLLGLGQLGDGTYARDLHFLVDHGGADIQRAAEYEGYAQDVVDLDGLVGAAGV